MLVSLLLMEPVVEQVVVVQEYQQLLALMVFLVEVLDITPVVEAEVATVVVDYQPSLVEKGVVELVVVMEQELLEQLIQVVEEVELLRLNQIIKMVEMVDLE